MGSPVDLTLGCSTQAATSDGCLNTSLYPGDCIYLESLRKAEEFLQSLQDERRKVEGFKRELPLCIQLLEDAIQSSKEKVASGKKELQVTRSSMDCENGNSREVEFLPLNMNMPLKRRWGAQSEGTSDGETEGTSDQRGSKRPAWMVEAQLWTQNSVSSDHTKDETEQLEQEQSSVTSSQQLLLMSKERPAGAFLPFLREQPGTPPVAVSRPIPRTGSGAGLSLSFGEPAQQACSPSGGHNTGLKTPADSEVGSIEALQHCTPDANNHNNNQQIPSVETAMAAACAGAGSSSGGQSQRKARRCWSPELHRRFVSALHQLGGCQIATPKQIRELMKVDGLTNDEVKSHLQKYRLHTRRPSPSPSQSGAAGAQQQQQQQGPPGPQLVVLGGIWVPPKYTGSGTPSFDPQQFQCPQDGAYFACISNGAPGTTVQMHHRQPLFEPSQSQCSPQGPLQVTSQLSGATQGPSSSEVYHDESGEEEEERDEQEQEQEDKSDSTSWKTQRRSSDGNKASPKDSELLNLQVAGRAVQSAVKNTAAPEEEVNQAQ